MDGIGDTHGIVKHAKGIHLGVETQTTAKTAYLVGETRAKKEEAIVVGDGFF